MNWELFFKPEVRSRGQKLFEADVVSTSAPSDTEISGFVKGYKVSFKSSSVTSSEINAQCSCSKKMCQHAWATLLKAMEKHPDFFDQKLEIVMDDKLSASSALKQDLRDRQKTYRKAQYQKIKQKLKDQKVVKLKSYPQEVEEALKYFLENGFSLDNPEDVESIQNCKKKLARVFHPDRGGSHDEIVQLNHNTEILIEYFTSLS